MVLLLSCGSLLLLLLLPLAMAALPGTRLLAALDADLLLPLVLVALVLLGAVATARKPRQQRQQQGTAGVGWEQHVEVYSGGRRTAREPGMTCNCSPAQVLKPRSAPGAQAHVVAHGLVLLSPHAAASYTCRVLEECLPANTIASHPKLLQGSNATPSCTPTHLRHQLQAQWMASPEGAPRWWAAGSGASPQCLPGG